MKKKNFSHSLTCLLTSLCMMFMCFSFHFPQLNAIDYVQDDFWSPNIDDFSGGTVSYIAIDPSNENIFYAATPMHGVYMSLDRGKKWEMISDNLKNKNFTYLAIDPYDNNCLYAASATELFRTYDKGLNWEKSSTNFNRINHMHILPGSSIFVSTNNGIMHSYSERNDFRFYSLTDNFARSSHALHIASNNSVSYLAVATNRTGIAISFNNGRNWNRARNNFPQGTVSAVFFDTQNQDRLYAVMQNNGLWSYDINKPDTEKDEIPWIKVMDLPNGNIIRALKSQKNNTDLFIGTDDNGLFKVNFAEKTSFKANIEHPANSILSIATTRQNPDLIIISNDIFGCIISNDYANIWNISNDGIQARSLHNLEISISDPNRWYVGSLGCIFSSNNAGQSWSMHYKGLPNSKITCMGISPVNPNHIYLGTETRGLYFSTNGGNSFQKIESFTFQRINCLLVDHQNESIIYVGIHGKEGVFKTSNRGASWDPMLLKQEHDGKGVFTTVLSADPYDSSIIYAGTNIDGIFKSNDAGRTWKHIYTVLGTNVYINDITISNENTDLIYAGIAIINDGGIIQSKNGGETWEALNIYRSGMVFNSIHIDPIDNRILFAGTNESIFLSKSGGIHWKNYDNGLESLYFDHFDHFYVNQIFSHPLDNRILVMTSRWGIYTTRKSDLTMDLIPPTITITSPENAEMSYTNQETYTIEGRVYDDSGIKKIIINKEDVSFDKESGKFSFDWIIRRVGIHELLITVTDNADNNSTKTINLFFDDIVPSVNLTNPFRNQRVESNSVLIAGSAMDHESGIGFVMANDFKIPIDITDDGHECTFSYDFKHLMPGDNNISVRVYDKAGNFREEARNVHFHVDDIEPPNIKITHPAERHSFFNQRTIAIQGNITDEVSGIFRATINQRDIDLDEFGNFSMNFNLIKGKNEFLVTAIDYSENESTFTFSVFYDDEPPIINLNINKIVRRAPHLLDYNITERNTGISKAHIKLNDTILWSEDEPTRYPEIKLMPTPGTNSLELFAEDRAGNVSFKKVEFEFLPPTIIRLTINKNIATLSDKEGERNINLDAPPFIRNGRTMVPLRFIAEAFGAQIEWIPHPTNEIQLFFKNKLIHLWINSNTVIVEYPQEPHRFPEQFEIDTPPILHNNRTMVPIRFIAEQFGTEVDWSNEKQEITIIWDSD